MGALKESEQRKYIGVASCKLGLLDELIFFFQNREISLDKRHICVIVEKHQQHRGFSGKSFQSSFQHHLVCLYSNENRQLAIKCIAQAKKYYYTGTNTFLICHRMQTFPQKAFLKPDELFVDNQNVVVHKSIHIPSTAMILGQFDWHFAVLFSSYLVSLSLLYY